MTKKQSILITGATAGIGRHAALHLAVKGHHVIATGRRSEALATLKAEAGSAHVNTVRLDVTDEQSIARAAQEVDRLTGGHGVDVLVNNAGYGLGGPLSEVTGEDLRAQMETNVLGLMAVTRAFLPKMQQRRSGRIVNVGSIGGRVTFPLFGAYHASKYAVEALSDALRVELSPFGIEVVLIEPGPIRSDFGERSLESIAGYRSDSSPYAPIYAQAEDIKAMSERQAVGPEHTSRAVERAITARRPRARYVVPFSSRLLLAALGMLPTWLLDVVMARFLGLTPKNLKLTAPQQASEPARRAA